MKPDLERRALDVVMMLADAEVSQRAELLQKQCGNDAELRAAVELLRASMDAVKDGSFLERPILEMLTSEGLTSVNSVKQSGVAPARLSTEPVDALSPNGLRLGRVSTGDPDGNQRVSRFVRQRLLGAGGQGEVWLALDPELDRQVALKVVRPGLRHSHKTIARFRREAEVTGKLEHPNIVPVYEAGQEANGSRDDQAATDTLPFYVMRVLGEQNFHQAIQKFHSGPWSESGLRDLLGHFINVCNAIAFAHSRGVIHRDLKPQNVMLGEFGETLVVDWGLAKVLGSVEVPFDADGATTIQIAAEDSLSRIGDIKGTPVYMSPEQACGEVQSLGPATDIYSLGAILFCVLTGQAPVTARPKRVATASDSGQPDSLRLSFDDIIERVRKGDSPKPTTIEPNAPKPLEAVCLKAMSLQPLDRYPTAKDLAADIHHWLNEDPVSAWTEPWTIRARRWIRRHQTAVSTTAAAVFVGLLGSATLAALVSSNNTKLNSLNGQLKQTNADLEKAQSELLVSITNEKEAAKTAREQSQLALSTLNSIIFDLQRALQNIPGGTSVRQRLLATALEKLDQISTEFVAKSAVDRNSLVALSDMAGTILQLGEVGQAFVAATPSSTNVSTSDAHSAVLTAERLFRRAHEIAQQLVASNPHNPQSKIDLSAMFDRLGEVSLLLGRTDEALSRFQDGLQIRKALSDADPNDAKKQRDLSVSFNRLGDVFLKLGRTADALTQFQDGLKIRRKLAESNPSDPQKQRDLSVSLSNLGEVFVRIGRNDEAFALYQADLQIIRALADADPHDAQRQHDLAVSYESIGDMYLTLGRIDDALTQFEAKLKISRTLVDADPLDTEKQRNLTLALNRVGNVFLMLNRTDEAFALFQEALTIRRKLAKADPNDVQKQRDLAFSLNNLGSVYFKLNRFQDALVPYQEGLQVRRLLADADPYDLQKQRELALSFERLGQISLALGQTAEALQYFQDEFVIAIRRMNAAPADVDAKGFTAGVHNILGDVYLKLGRTDDALKHFQDGLQIRRIIAETDPSNAPWQRNLMVNLSKLAEAQVQSGQFDQAYETFSQGLAVLDGMIGKGQSVKSSEQDKVKLEQRRQFCTVAKLATGDWDKLLKVDIPMLPQLLTLRATEMLNRGNLDNAVQAADKLREFDLKNPNTLYDAACCYSKCVSTIDALAAKTTATTDPKDIESPQRQLRSKCMTQALDTLQAAVAAGFTNAGHMAQNSDLKPLRELPEFKRLLGQLRGQN